MNNPVNIFQRVEEKYFMDKKTKDKFFEDIKNYIDKDKYYESKILSIYFDNDNKDIVRTSLDKPIYKDKVRLRSYGVPSIDSNVFLEIKNKFEGVTGKRRIMLTLGEFYDYFYNNKIKDDQIMKEIDYLVKYYNLKPNCFVGYDRLSFIGKDDLTLRITVDSNLRSRLNDLKLEDGDYGNKYFEDDIYIMEIKTLNSMPIWLTKELSKLKIFPISFSKYGEVYKKEVNYA